MTGKRSPIAKLIRDGLRAMSSNRVAKKHRAKPPAAKAVLIYFPWPMRESYISTPKQRRVGVLNAALTVLTRNV